MRVAEGVSNTGWLHASVHLHYDILQHSKYIQTHQVGYNPSRPGPQPSNKKVTTRLEVIPWPLGQLDVSQQQGTLALCTIAANHVPERHDYCASAGIWERTTGQWAMGSNLILDPSSRFTFFRHRHHQIHRLTIDSSDYLELLFSHDQHPLIGAQIGDPASGKTATGASAAMQGYLGR